MLRSFSGHAPVIFQSFSDYLIAPRRPPGQDVRYNDQESTNIGSGRVWEWSKRVQERSWRRLGRVWGGLGGVLGGPGEVWEGSGRGPEGSWRLPRRRQERQEHKGASPRRPGTPSAGIFPAMVPGSGAVLGSKIDQNRSQEAFQHQSFF